MTMMEVIVVLAVLGIMAALLTPMVMNYVEDSQLSAAQGDVSTIAASILKLSRDVGHFPLYKDGTKTTWDPDFDLLVSGGGNDPVDGTGKWLSTDGGGFPGGGATGGQFPGQGQGNQGQFPGQGSGGSVKTDGLDSSAKVLWVLSAGPNGRIETDPTALADTGPIAGGDDIAVRLK